MSVNIVFVFANPKGENVFLIVFVYIIFIANKNEYVIHLLIFYFTSFSKNYFRIAHFQMMLNVFLWVWIYYVR